MSAPLPRPVVSEPPPYAPPAAAAATCANCGVALLGHYCHACGAPRADERPLTVGRFAGELVNEVTSVDSVTVSTLRALVGAPGRLTAEYVAGRTRRYLSPLRLFLMAWALFLLSTSLYTRNGPVDAMRLEQQFQAKEQSDTALSGLMARSARRHATSRDEQNARLIATFGRYAMNPWVRLVDPLTVGLLLALLYRGRRRSYAEHVVFALHLLAFNALLSVVTAYLHWLAGGMGPLNRMVSVLHWATLGVYFFIAARTLHAEARGRTLAKTVGFVAGAQVAMVLVPVAAMVVAIVQVMAR